ncbi:MAG: 16S rRNA (cytidine(1402)-2'-O)-methyltransferase [Alphaproteobacteria bacterium]|nr:16S rRNA (cytidine(1402)-2'-O)-methyltransferase [Alphaproteobacteria bacterium]
MSVALWIVATPIGTLDDCSPRARRVLAEAAVIAAEDTRTTRKLLGALDLPAPPLVALHAHNEAQRAEALAARALQEEVALVTDAGTPGISDPGRELVRACLEAGVRVLSVPGPSALAAALAASGMPVAPSTFLGFPPRKGRDGWADEVLRRPETLVCFEAPSRLPDLVARLAARSPAREAVLCRELSKRHEEVLRAPLEALAGLLADRSLKGECVLVVGPGEALEAASGPEVGEGASLKDVAAVLATRWGISRREAYQRLLALET